MTEIIDNFNRETELKKFKNKFKGRYNLWWLWPVIYALTWSRLQNSSYQHFATFTRKHKNKRYLDVGTGSGEYIALLERHNYYIFSDINSIALKKTKAKAKKHLFENSWHLMDGTAKQILTETDKVNYISFLHVLSVLPYPNRLLRLAYEKLQPDGMLLIYLNRVHSGDITWWKKYIISPLYQLFRVRVINIEKILTDAYNDKKIERKKIELTGANDCYLIKKLSA